MSTPHRVTIDCYQCGERYVDINIHDWIAAGNNPDQFPDQLAALTRAHDDTCTPQRTPPTKANRRRRRAFWAAQLCVPILWPTIAVLNLISDEPEPNFIVALAVGAAISLAGTLASIGTYRQGYQRGRATWQDPVVIDRNLHPADQWKNVP